MTFKNAELTRYAIIKGNAHAAFFFHTVRNKILAKQNPYSLNYSLYSLLNYIRVRVFARIEKSIIFSNHILLSYISIMKFNLLLPSYRTIVYPCRMLVVFGLRPKMSRRCRWRGGIARRKARHVVNIFRQIDIVKFQVICVYERRTSRWLNRFARSDIVIVCTCVWVLLRGTGFRSNRDKQFCRTPRRSYN